MGDVDARVKRIVETEPELPGEMPEEMYRTYVELAQEKETLTEALRLLVQATKASILERLETEA